MMCKFTLEVIFFFWLKMADSIWRTVLFPFSVIKDVIITSLLFLVSANSLILSVTLLFMSIFLFMTETWILPINLKAWPHNDAKLRHYGVNQVMPRCLKWWVQYLCEFIQFNSIYFSQYALTNPKSKTKVFYSATTALVPFTINTGEEPERATINK